MSESRGDNDGEHGVPNKELDDGGSGDVTLFPGDPGVCEVGNNGGNSGGDEVGEPKIIIIFNDKIR